MAWQYLVVCLFDFLFAPILTGWYAWFAKVPYEAWKPITMSEGGFYHMAMGAIVGITAWTRGNEKIARHQSYSPPIEEQHTEDFDEETRRRIAEARTRK